MNVRKPIGAGCLRTDMTAMTIELGASQMIADAERETGLRDWGGEEFR